MSPGHFTTLVRYEWSGDCFRWNFYRGDLRVKSIKKVTAVIQAAEKLVDAR